MKNADKPSMPFQEVTGIINGKISAYTNHNGMTKREMIAMHALTHMMSKFNPYECGDFDSSDYDDTVKHAVGLADALLKELEK